MKITNLSFIIAFSCSSSLLLNACSEVKTPQAVELHQAKQQDINEIADNLQVKFSLVTNQPSEHCDPDKTDGDCFTAQLTLTALDAIKATNWQIYFSQITPIQSSQSDEFVIEHINGDIHRISMKPEYAGFGKNEAKTITFYGSYWSLSETDAMPNYLVTAPDLNAQVIKSTKAKIDPETGLEILPHVTPYTSVEHHFKRTESDSTQWLTSDLLYQRNQATFDAPLDTDYLAQAIIPTPKSVELADDKRPVAIKQGISVNFNQVPSKAVNAALERLATLGVKQVDNGIAVNLFIEATPEQVNGSYKLSVSDDAINIVGQDEAGVFYGLQSLASLVDLNSDTIPQLTIIDAPLFEFRGMLVDVARNFKSKDFILKLLDQMAAYKLNKFHFHLADDEGWRIEIPSLPELTQIGSQRCFDITEQHCLMPQLGAGIETDSEVNGYYSVADYQEILRYASARHIQVIPSLDMPGHSRAAVKAMNARFNTYKQQEQLDKANEFLLYEADDYTKYSSVQYYQDNTINVCLDSSYRFVEHLMKEVQQIHQAAEHPLTRYHIGADETAGAWVESPACKAFLANNDQGITEAKQLSGYFVERVATMIAKLGIEPAAWADGLEHTRVEKMPSVVQANAWGPLMFGSHSQTHELANRQWQVVISSPDALYFDFPYEADPKEHGYYWASREINTEKVFQFMPENLPIHAEFWTDRQNNPYEADDTKKQAESGHSEQGPLDQGVKFYGVQGQLWTENTRSDDMAEHKIFPRLLALAERAWYKPKWAVDYNYQGAKYSQQSNVFSTQHQALRDQQWQRFSQVIGSKELAKVEAADIAYRLPTVGAKIIDGKLHANIAFKGLTIEYKDASNVWQTYEKPTLVKGQVVVRARTFDGKRVGRSWQVVQ
ncbi:carbohydate-binding domain-containing protein [Thalassotalea sp. LPB0316]|uniref:family 20 glycosylhydrolase n=1 Tax=Thalassotalea sp. LPB0316 TaxID=2769490 RepID=UPI001867ACD4|nr:family 20 glycosylhydrolase [Thalassotalea sp. LPB0316]QOL25528.1 carbohydate-binding domain-containing protein [Thalassotalea sp. LPB0316]